MTRKKLAKHRKRYNRERRITRRVLGYGPRQFSRLLESAARNTRNANDYSRRLKLLLGP